MRCLSYTVKFVQWPPVKLEKQGQPNRCLTASRRLTILRAVIIKDSPTSHLIEGFGRSGKLNGGYCYLVDYPIAGHLMMGSRKHCEAESIVKIERTRQRPHLSSSIMFD